MPDNMFDGRPRQEEGLAAKYRTRCNDASIGAQIAGGFPKRGIVQTSDGDPAGLDWLPLMKIVPKMPVELQIILQKENVVGVRLQTFLQGQVGAMRLFLARIITLVFIDLNMKRFIAPVGPGQAGQSAAPQFGSFRTRNHHCFDPWEFGAQSCRDFCWPVGRWHDPAIQVLAQLRYISAALLFKPKILYALVAQKDVPLVNIAVLENPASFKIMLAHRSGKGVNGLLH